MYNYIKNLWLSISLKRKLGFYSGMVILVMGLSAGFNMYLSNYVIGNFNMILNDNSKCQDLQQAMEMEAEAFEDFIRERNQENREVYGLACLRTEQCLKELPFDYRKIGAERYARTWNMINGYEGYQKMRDDVLQMDPEDGNYIIRLYQVYGVQEYLQTFARRLLQTTMAESDANYQAKAQLFYHLPSLIILVSVIMMVFSMGLTHLLSNTFLRPLSKLVGSTRKIAVNDFSGEDLVVENKDEMGEMVHAFNKMKHATKGYIDTLMKNYEMSELLHKEEMERVETEKRLQAARLELLKSQINPHFLFNTLNMISCMAKLEEASTTERMINSMSNLFRYNLKTSEQIVPLAQELKVVQDYIYIQKMRFGSRVQYDSDVRVDASQIMIPAFTLQPVVENAIIHGLAKKEQGGRIYLRAWLRGETLVLSVADTGLGMSEEKRQALLDALAGRRTERIGIGLGNIYKRIRSMYADGDLRIYSKEDRGTVIQMWIPQTNQGEELNIIKK